MIRPAKCQDIPAVVALLQEGHSRSRYAKFGPIDVAYTKKLLLNFIPRHWQTGIFGTHCNVADRDGKLVGLHFGLKQRVEDIGSLYTAIEFKFYVSDRSSPFAAAALVKSFIKWAESDPKVIEVRPAATDIIDDWHVAAKFYESAGFTQSGAIFRRAA